MSTEFLSAFDDSGLQLINRKLETFDLQQKQIANMKSLVNVLQGQVLTLQNTKQTVGSDNVLFTWTGSTLKVSWAAAYVQNKDTKIYPIVAGSVVVLASTFYWFSWNPVSQTMSNSTNLSTLTALPNSIIICQVFTGTAGQTGTAGGGGSDPGGVGPIGKEYKLF